MKRVFPLLLAVLMLCGCAAAPSDSPVSTESADPAATTGPALYDPTHPLEADTDGAVRVFELADGGDAVAVIGEYVVVFSGNVLRSYAGEALHLVKERQLQTHEMPGSPDVRITAEALGYYDEVDHTVVILNGALKKLTSVKLSDSIQGSLVLDENLDAVYYCTEDSIRVLNLKTGNSQMLRQQGYTAQMLVSGCFGGDILGCEVYNRDKQYLCYIDSETGELLGTSDSGISLHTGEAFYFTRVTDGETVDYLFGKIGQEPGSFRPASPQAQIVPALEMGGVLTALEGEAGLALDFYDLDTGLRAASVTLNGVSGTVRGSWADGGRNCLWLLIGDALYRWELDMTPSGDAAVYTGQRYTPEHPDTEGLAACQQKADAIGQKYGVQIRVSDPPEGCGFKLTQEYLVQPVEDALEALDGALSRYHETLLTGINSVSGSGKVTISLVREIEGERSVAQYWSGKDACVVLELGDGLEGRLDNGLYHVLDTFLFNHTSELDQWDECNPKGFRYDLNETDYLTRQDDSLLTGDKRAFVSSFSMSYPIEDRAAIFQCAMSGDGAEVFASKTMQQKLQTLCRAIRNACGWKKSEEVFLWEQYLEQSIAYKPKK